MAGEEVVIRIVLQDGGGGIGQLPAPFLAGLFGLGGGQATGGQARGPRGGRPRSQPFDPLAEAKKQIEAERQRYEIEQARNKLFQGPPSPQFDPVLIAEKQLEAEARLAEVRKERERLVPTVKEIFDPIELAKKRLEADKRRAAIDREYAKIAPPDPDADERKNREYNNQLLRLASSLRGTIGGIGGPAVGGTLDALANFQQANDLRAKEEAGEAAKGSANLAGMAASAGAAAAIVAVLRAVDEKVKGGIRSGIGVIGGGLAGIASANDDPSVAIYKAGDAASKFGSEISMAVPVVGHLILATGEVGKAFANLMQELDKTAERYGEYSPAIAQEQALADVRRTMGDFRRAQETGPDLARYVRNQSELQQKFEDIKVKLLTRILEVVNPMLQILEKVVPSGQGIETAINVLGGPLVTLAQVTGEIANFLSNNREEEIEDPTSVMQFSDEFLNQRLST